MEKGCSLLHRLGHGSCCGAPHGPSPKCWRRILRPKDHSQARYDQLDLLLAKFQRTMSHHFPQELPEHKKSGQGLWEAPRQAGPARTACLEEHSQVLRADAG